MKDFDLGRRSIVAFIFDTSKERDMYTKSLYNLEHNYVITAHKKENKSNILSFFRVFCRKIYISFNGILLIKRCFVHMNICLVFMGRLFGINLILIRIINFCQATLLNHACTSFYYKGIFISLFH